MKRLVALAVIAVAALTAAGRANAQSTISLDENGVSAPAALLPDPGPGGLTALTYSLGAPVTEGDVLVLEPGALAASDLLRFNANEPCLGSIGCVVVYSDQNEGADALADTGLPTAFYANILSVSEVGTEGNNGISYTPIAGQPGFIADAPSPVTYVFTSDTSIPTPEPTSLAMMGAGLAGLRLIRRRRNSPC